MHPMTRGSVTARPPQRFVGLNLECGSERGQTRRGGNDWRWGDGVSVSELRCERAPDDDGHRSIACLGRQRAGLYAALVRLPTRVRQRALVRRVLWTRARVCWALSGFRNLDLTRSGHCSIHRERAHKPAHRQQPNRNRDDRRQKGLTCSCGSHVSHDSTDSSHDPSDQCQWQPKTAHLWQPKTAHFWGGRLGRSGHSPGDARRACWAGRRERSDRSPGQHAPRSCGAGGHVATPSRCSSDAVLSQC